MFDDSMFEKWLDNKTNDIVDKMAKGEKIESEEMMVLVLKAQSNHFHHLDKDLREDMILLDKSFKESMQESNKEFRSEMKILRENIDKSNKEFRKEVKDLREDMDKRFEQVDKRFEQVDKRFDAVILRMDRFMIWSLGLTFSSTIFIIGFLKFT